MAAPVVESFEVTQNGTAGTSVVITKPTGVVAGDLLVAPITCDATGVGITAPAGWRTYGFEVGDAHTTKIFWKLATASEPASYTFTLDSAQENVGSVIRISGADSLTPNDSFGAPATGTSATPTCPDILGPIGSFGTTVDECLVLRIFGADDDDINTDAGYPAGTNGIYVRESAPGLGTCAQGAAWEEQVTAGQPGTAAFSMTATEQWSAFTIAIAPPQPAEPTNPDIKSAWVEFTSPAGTGNQAITGVGFQPKAILFFGNTRADDLVGNNTARFTGATDGTNERSVTVSEVNGAVGGNAARGASVTECINCLDESGADVRLLVATLASFDADGFTLNWIATSNNRSIRALCLGGADLTAHVSDEEANDSPKSSVPFRPDLVFTFGAAMVGTADDGFGLHHPIGAFDQNYDQWFVASFQGGDGSDQATKDSLTFSDGFAGQVFQGARTWHNEVTTITNQGWGFDGEPDADLFYFLALNLKRRGTFVGIDTLPTVTGNADLPDFGFIPQVYLLGSGNEPDEVATTPNGVSVTVGGYDGAEQTALAYKSQNSAQFTQQVAQPADVYSALFKGATGGYGIRGTAQAITDSTPTINWSTVADTRQAIFGIAGIEQVDAGVILLSGTIAGQSALSANIVLVEFLSATVTGQSAVTANLGVERPVSATVTALSTVAAAVAVLKPLAATSAGQSALTAALALERGLAATVAGQSALTADLAVEKALTATVAGQSAVAANLNAEWSLDATVTGQSQVMGDLAPLVPVRATVTALSTLAATLSVEIPLSATVTGQSALAAALEVEKGLDATVTGQSSVAGALDVEHTLDATITGQSTAAAAVAVLKPFGANVTAQTTIAAALQLERGLAATIEGVSALSGILTEDVFLSSTVSGQSTLIAALLGFDEMSGTITAQSSISAVLDLEPSIASPNTVAEVVIHRTVAEVLVHRTTVEVKTNE